MPNWTDLLSNSDRRFYPEVVVPLAHDTTTTVTAKKSSSPSPSSDESSLQEKGVSGPLTVEGLQTEIEAGVVASGHDSAYDRMHDAVLVVLDVLIV